MGAPSRRTFRSTSATSSTTISSGPTATTSWPGPPLAVRSGWEAINYGRYANPVFDSLLAAAGNEPEPDRAADLYRRAVETLNADAPAIFLYAPSNTAVVSRRIENVEIDPYSWASGLRDWRAAPPAPR